MEQLKLLSVFHFVLAGITGIFSLFPIIHLVIGIIVLNSPEAAEPDEEYALAIVGLFFVVMPALIILTGLTLSALMIAAGVFLSKRQKRKFCTVIGGLECLVVPFGTVLGVFTILVLMRESVIQLFESEQT